MRFAFWHSYFIYTIEVTKYLILNGFFRTKTSAFSIFIKCAQCSNIIYISIFFSTIFICKSIKNRILTSITTFFNVYKSIILKTIEEKCRNGSTISIFYVPKIAIICLFGTKKRPPLGWSKISFYLFQTNTIFFMDILFSSMEKILYFCIPTTYF